jgi:hypothetical protein
MNAIDTWAWKHISTAPRDESVEIIGIQFEGRGYEYIAEGPFITFWSPTQQRFWKQPTHWLPMPPRPRSYATMISGE